MFRQCVIKTSIQSQNINVFSNAQNIQGIKISASGVTCWLNKKLSIESQGDGGGSG